MAHQMVSEGGGSWHEEGAGLQPGLQGLGSLLKAEEGEKLQVSWQLLVTQDSEQGSALEYHQKIAVQNT